ncbi:MMPL family transporter [Thermoleophilia bacterium SCSIO 60948]|nr:MMPL family transporter [Thermoleophilia bacterium SCSIO 60948]
MFSRLGSAVTAHPWRVIAVWIIAVAITVPLSPGLGAVTNEDQTSFLPSDYESVRADELAREAFPEQSGSTALFVVRRQDGAALTAPDRRQIAELVQDLEGSRIERVRGVQTGPEQLSPDRRVQLVAVALEGLPSDDPVAEAVDRLRAAGDEALAGSGLQAGVTGDAAILKDTRESYRDAEGIVGIATVVLIIALLGAIYRSPLAALMPIVSIGLVYATATSLIALVADVAGFEVSPELTSLLIVVLFGIGTDYLLFFFFRFRERLRAGAEADEAVRFSIARVGEAIASAALVVMVAFLALVLSKFESFQSMGPALVIAIGVMLLAALTLIPAVVALLGTRIFWPSSSWRRPPQASASRRLGQRIGRRPGPVAAATGAVLVALAVGTAFFTADYNTVAQLPDDTESARAFEDLRGSFPAGALNPTQVYVRGESLDRAALADLTRELSRVDGVASVRAAQVAPSGDVASITVALEQSPFSNAALDLVEGPVRDIAHRAETGETVLVGGQTSAFVDVRSAINRDYRVVFPVAAALILLILVALLRSLVAPLYLLASVALGFAATLGATVAVFQGLGGEPGLNFALPLILYLFVVAIGTDYNILMTARLREEYKEGLDPRRAADMSVEHTAPTVWAAGVILAGTFASLILTGIGALVEMGFAVSIGIVLSAFVMAAAFVPSVAALVGRRIWWPGHQGDPTAPAEREALADRPPSVSTSAPAGSSRSGAPDPE